MPPGSLTECRNGHPRLVGERCRICTREANNRHQRTDKHRAYMRRWNRQNRAKVKASKLKTRYGITAAQYRTMHEDQLGLCAICQQPETTLNHKGEIKILSVDHDHKTGVVRALLCHHCNNAIGHLRENPETCRAAAEYLEAY